MTDPVSLLRVPVLDLRSGESVLDDEAAHYVVRVRRLCAGDRFVAFDPSARVESDAEVTSTSREVTCRFGSLRVAQGVPRREVTLIQGIGKGEKPERVVRDATALGVSRVILVESARTVARVIGGGDRGVIALHTVAEAYSSDCCSKCGGPWQGFTSQTSPAQDPQAAFRGTGVTPYEEPTANNLGPDAAGR